MSVSGAKSDRPAATAYAIDPSYRSGEYFRTPQRHAEDAPFKARNFLELLAAVHGVHRLQIGSYADVGCGSGHGARLVAEGLAQAGFTLASARAYDVSPHVATLRANGVEFVHADFCDTRERADLVTLFDVFEHVVDPVAFLRAVAAKCDLIGLHVPLDDSLNHAVRDKFRVLLRDPGHLVFLDAASALNLLTLSGLRVLDYRYTFAFRAPSGRQTVGATLLYPARRLIAALSPWLLSRTLGGASLMVIAATASWLRRRRDAG